MNPVEDTFASDTFRRVILPGIVLAVGVHPLIAQWTGPVESLYGVGPALMLVGEVIFFGLVVSSSVQWIYYVYEGFRLEWLTSCAHKRNKARLLNLKRSFGRLRNIQKPSQHVRDELFKVYETLLDFPVVSHGDGSWKRIAERTTRLGNIIAVYKLHPETRYGVDSILYWFHLLNLAPDRVQKDFSDKIAFAERLVLTSFSGALFAVLQAFVLIGFGIEKWFRLPVFVTLRVGPAVSTSLLGFGVAVWLLVLHIGSVGSSRGR